MNVYDSRLIESLLTGRGHTPCAGPDAADVVIVNTCSVRERAETRVLGRLKHLRGLMPPGAVLGVVGCVAQRRGDELMREVPGLGFVVGTDGYLRLPDVVEEACAGRGSVDVRRDAQESYDGRPAPARAGLREFVSVMRGCDNFCTYCVVPYVRGRERSRPLASILREVSALVRLGARDITLIGQNVNSYRDGEVSFADLLRAVAETDGLSRLRFATSHPKDLSDDLIEAVASTGEVCEHIHLPVQSGSDAVLRAMNRRYTREQYLRLVERIRSRIPGAALTTDIIVGFPGETDAQFRETVSLMEEVRFDSAFMFRYSVRKGTRAADMSDDVPEEGKLERLEHIIALQQRITSELNLNLVGSECEVLVEGPSAKNRELLFGRTRTAKAVVFPGDPSLAGDVVRVRVETASAWTLHGSLTGGA